MRQHYWMRLFEILPGTLVWTTLAGVVVLSFFMPLGVIYFIIVFDLYWLIRICYMLIYVLLSWFRLRTTMAVDWYKTLQQTPGDYRQYYHLIFLPTYKEPYAVVEKPFKALIDSRFDLRQCIVVLAGEERDREHFLSVADEIRKNYEHHFLRFIVTVHPKNIPGELPGKGSNTHYAARQAQKIVDELGLPYERVIVSNFDIDTCIHPNYLALLTHTYMTHPNPTRASYQPVAVYNNNIWESNPIVRVVASSTTFWLLTDLSRAERLLTFSSHSMSFKALVDVGFWDNTIVTEDSRIFLQCLVRYDGDYQTVPLYLPVYMNTVDIGELRRSLVNQYKQMRRWAWGVEHFPWMMRHFWFTDGLGKRVPLKKKLYYLWIQTEGVYSWATAPLIILLAGYLPLWLATEAQRATALFQNAPYMLSSLMQFSMVGLIVTAILYTLMLPPRPADRSLLNYTIMIGQWLLAPLTLIVFGSLPATDAQTRLMLGGKFRLGFWVTEKK